MLIAPDGSTITRDGATLMSLAWQCQQALQNADAHGQMVRSRTASSMVLLLSLIHI